MLVRACYLPAQRGVTLLEVLLASLISSVLILTMSQLIVSEVRVADRQSRTMQLHQQLRASLTLMKRNLRMAGFNAATASAVFLRKSPVLTDVRHATHQVGYVSQQSLGGTEDFRHVVYQLTTNSAGEAVLRLCEKQHDHQLTFEQAASSGESGPCFSLFDSDWIHVDAFQVDYQPLDGGTRSALNTGWIVIQLRLSLVQDPSIHATADIAFLQRHWS
ncbi:prepilin-type N-terminal cleavage/methylation domain-containing protein [Vibrio rhizosphaerae]|uniref:Prepilin-type N-terminal cleavage/methylation domain-containing protein n=1 Tax=Vibrio rhizosphaerae TaxID=398736 RepID=A0ABU4ISI5_9VIBR|nr:prepilin-type N-terminal cleavage/methylation domain-containing protein [Vibrio rhizosphaerae]MDW6092249.1 prepilin-type N-terminal cleavage/methylation domain-containing protein [Vibrio rhizosphaerae]